MACHVLCIYLSLSTSNLGMGSVAWWSFASLGPGVPLCSPIRSWNHDRFHLYSYISDLDSFCSCICRIGCSITLLVANFFTAVEIKSSSQNAVDLLLNNRVSPVLRQTQCHTQALFLRGYEIGPSHSRESPHWAPLFCSNPSGIPDHGDNPLGHQSLIGFQVCTSHGEDKQPQVMFAPSIVIKHGKTLHKWCFDARKKKKKTRYVENVPLSYFTPGGNIFCIDNVHLIWFRLKMWHPQPPS